MKKRIITSALPLLIAIFLAACQTAGDEGSPAEQAQAQCREIARVQFDPVYMLNNPPSKTRDLDGDRVPDVIELQMKTDVCSIDSDMDGLTDFHEAVLAGKMKSEFDIKVDVNCKKYGTECDADGDGISDFQETHGFYWDSHARRFSSVSRIMPMDDWEALKKTETELLNGEPNPWKVALDALEYAGLRRTVSIDDKQYALFEIDSSARAVLIKSFLNLYGNEQHGFLERNTEFNGSVANIMLTLRNKPQYKKALDGKNVEIFFTDHNAYSSDYDPYSDAQEVSRVNAMPDVIHPADHPLIAGYPRIRPTIHKIIILPKQKITDSKGNSVTDEWSTTMTTMKKKTEGWSIGGKVGGSQDKGAEAGISGGYSNQTTNMNSTAVKEGGKSQVDFKNAESYDTACAAHAWFEISFENVGTAAIEEMQPAFNIHVKDNMYTFSPNALNRIPLKVNRVAPGFKSKRYTLPYVGESGAARSAVVCLTIDDLAYIENDGGQVMIEMIPNEGKILYWDKTSNVLGTKGQWTQYKGLIDATGSKIDYTIVDTNNKVHQGNYIAYAGASPRLTLGEALKQMLTDPQLNDSRRDIALPACPANGVADKACMGANGVIQLGEALNTFVAIHAFDNKNQLIPEADISADFKQKLTSGKVMDLPLNPRWRYEVISYEGVRAPYASGTRVDADSTGFTVSGWASDDYGSDVKAEFCKKGYAGDQQSAECSPMNRIALTNGAMKQFSIVLPNNYTFKGEEHMRIINSDGATKVALESVDVTEVGFKLSGRTQALINYYNNILNRLSEYKQRVHNSILARLGRNSYITNNLEQYKRDVESKKAEVQALVSYCANTNAKNINNLEELKTYTRKCTSTQEMTLLEQKKAAIEGKTVLPEWTKLVSKVSVNLYTRNKNDFTFWQARRDMETDYEEPSDYEYFTVGVSCGVPRNRVITRVRVDAGYKGHTKGSNRVRRSSSHLREIHFDSYTINPHTYAFENKRSYSCQTNDRRAFWRTEVNDGNFHSETQSVNPNNREYITAVGLSLDDAHVRLCVKYASIDAISGQTTYRTSKGSRCSNAEKTSWSWSRQGGKPTLALIGLKIGNGYGNTKRAKIDRNNVRHLASSYSKVDTAGADIYNQPPNPALLKNEQLRQLSTKLVQWTNQQNAISPSKMPVNRLDDPSLVVGKTLDGFQLGQLVCPKLGEFLQKSQNEVFANLMDSQQVSPVQAKQIAFDKRVGWVNRVKAAAVEWTKNPSPTADYLSKNPIKVDELHKINVSACGFLGKAWQHYYTELNR